VSSEYEDPIDALAELWAEGDPEPDPGFVDRLDSRLRVAHAQRRQTPVIAGRSWGRLAGLVTVAVVVVAAASVSLAYRDGAVSSALEMSDASGVTLTMPDGSTVDDPADGFELPNGTVIVIKIGGSAVIDDVILEEGAVVTVQDGALVTDTTIDLAGPPSVDETTVDGVGVDPRGSSSVTASDPGDDSQLSPTPTDVRPDPPMGDPGNTMAPTPSGPGRSLEPVPGDSVPPIMPLPPETGGPAVTIEPRPIGPPVTIEPGPVGPPVTIEPGPVGPPVTIEPGPVGPPVTITPGPVGPPVTIEPPSGSVGPPRIAPPPGLTVPVGLRVSRRGHTRQVRVAWTSGSPSTADWRAVVIRSTAATPPTWPVAGATVIVGESPAAVPGSAVDDVPPGAQVARYRVVLVDLSGAVIGASVVQSVNFG